MRPPLGRAHTPLAAHSRCGMPQPDALMWLPRCLQTTSSVRRYDGAASSAAGECQSKGLQAEVHRSTISAPCTPVAAAAAASVHQ